MKRTLISALAMVMLVACGGSDYTTGYSSEASSEAVLNTTARSEIDGSWTDGPSVSGISWRLVDLLVDESLRISYNMIWTNNDPSRAVTVSYQLHFLDANGVELAKDYGDSVTIPAASSAQVGAIVKLYGVTEVSFANQISEMDVWADFTFN